MPSLTARARGFFRCRVLRPLLRLVRHGVSSRRLGWSLAIALVIGINPLLGVTTITMILIASIFRLNHVATQIGIHLVSPLQWLLFIPFIRIGTFLFQSDSLPLSKSEILHLSHRHPFRLVRILWEWEWHALIVWVVVAAILAPPLAFLIRRALVVASRRHRDLLA